MEQNAVFLTCFFFLIFQAFVMLFIHLLLLKITLYVFNKNIFFLVETFHQTLDDGLPRVGWVALAGR